MSRRKIFLCCILMIVFFNCINNELPEKERISNRVAIILKEIKQVEYLKGSVLKEKAALLRKVNVHKDSLIDVFYRYYKLKAKFLEKYNAKVVEEFNTIYEDLKKYKLYKLMAEVDILSTHLYYTYNNYAKASEYAKRAAEYCFEPDMFLERQALIYGISPSSIRNTPEEKRIEIIGVLKELEAYEWGYYHTLIIRNLASANYRLKNYEEAKANLLEGIEKCKKINNNYSLGFLYELMAPVEEKLTKNYKQYIYYYKEAIKAKETYGNEYLVIDYRGLGHKFFGSGEIQKAYEYYSKAVNFKNVDSASLSVDYAYLGWAFFNLDTINNSKKAMKYYDKALSYTQVGHVGHRMALERKIWTLTKLNRVEEADTYKIKLLEAQNNNYKKTDRNHFKDFQINTILKIRDKNFRVKELEKDNKLKESLIEKQEIIKGAFIVFLVMFLLFLYQFYFNVKNLNKVKTLNVRLEKSLLKIETINSSLKEKNKEVLRLLELNERSLFAQVLKNSTYKDAIDKLANQLSSLTKNLDKVKSSSLFSIERTLRTLINEEEVWESFKIQFEKIRPDFFEKLKNLMPSLSVNDLKHCAYMVSNLKTKEVASLVNLSPRSVEAVRYRLKKKLNLSKEESLFDFLQKL